MVDWIFMSFEIPLINSRQKASGEGRESQEKEYGNIK
jgi:hypothetical protein